MLTSIPLHHLTACKYINMGMAVDNVEQPTSSQQSLNIITDARHHNPRITLPTHQKRPSLVAIDPYCHGKNKRKTHEMRGDACSRPRWISAEESSSYTIRNRITTRRSMMVHQNQTPPNTPRRSGEGVGGVTRRQIYGGQKKKEKE